MRRAWAVLACVLAVVLAVPAPALAWHREEDAGWTLLVADPAGGWHNGNSPGEASGVTTDAPILFDDVTNRALVLPGEGGYIRNEDDYSTATSFNIYPQTSIQYLINVPTIAVGTTWVGVVDMWSVVVAESEDGWLTHYANGNTASRAKLYTGAAQLAKTEFDHDSSCVYPFQGDADAPAAARPFNASTSVWSADVWIAIERVATSSYTWGLFVHSTSIGVGNYARTVCMTGTAGAISLGEHTSSIEQDIAHNMRHFDPLTGNVTAGGADEVVGSTLLVYGAETTDPWAYELIYDRIGMYAAGELDPRDELVPEGYQDGDETSQTPVWDPADWSLPESSTVPTDVLEIDVGDLTVFNAYDKVSGWIKGWVNAIKGFFWWSPFFTEDITDAGW